MDDREEINWVKEFNQDLSDRDMITTTSLPALAIVSNNHRARITGEIHYAENTEDLLRTSNIGPIGTCGQNGGPEGPVGPTGCPEGIATLPKGRYDPFADQHTNITQQYNKYGDYMNSLKTKGDITVTTGIYRSDMQAKQFNADKVLAQTKDWGKVQPIEKSDPKDEAIPFLAETAAMLKVSPINDPSVEMAAYATDGHYYDLTEVIHAHTKLMLTMLGKTTKKW